MFVRVFNEPFCGSMELSLHMLGDVRPRSGGEGSRIGTIMSDRVVYCPHPAQVTRAVLRLCAGSLAGAEDLQLNLPPLMEMGGAPRSMRGQYLDLTGEHIRIVEETAPCGADGHLLLDGLKTRILNTFAYDKQAALKKNQEEARKKAQQEMLKTAVIGQLIPGKGIYGGVWEPKDRDGKSLGKKFVLWWDEHDLRDAFGQRTCLTFVATVATLAGQKDGLNISHENYDTLLHEALRDGSGVGKRFIPPRELLCGKDVRGNEVFAEYLYKNHDVGAFRDNGGFVTDGRLLGTGSDGLDYPVSYWSGTVDRHDSSCVLSTSFSDGKAFAFPKHFSRRSCRPVRVEVLDI